MFLTCFFFFENILYIYNALFLIILYVFYLYLYNSIGLTLGLLFQ